MVLITREHSVKKKRETFFKAQTIEDRTVKMKRRKLFITNNSLMND